MHRSAWGPQVHHACIAALMASGWCLWVNASASLAMKKAVEMWGALVRNGEAGNPRDHQGGSSRSPSKASMIFNLSGMSVGVGGRGKGLGAKGFVRHAKTKQKTWSCLLFSACPTGFYRMDMNTLRCLKCPQHSIAETEGSTICTCENGHFRAPGEGPQVACTRKSCSQGLVIW